MTPRVISIHALRVEGDLNTILVSPYVKVDFYPRPPGGGRLLVQSAFSIAIKFLSTPSGWRATATNCVCIRKNLFLSTPSGWRATDLQHLIDQWIFNISIHALRVEGDSWMVTRIISSANFYPRPPGGGRLTMVTATVMACGISIHALRVEGDR